MSFWKPVVDRIVARQSFSFGGRLVLLKYVLSSLPVYFLSFFKAPASIISSIESIFKRFFGRVVRILLTPNPPSSFGTHTESQFIQAIFLYDLDSLCLDSLEGNE
jgi:hypothetical protein